SKCKDTNVEPREFLHGLNSEYDPIRVQILGEEKFPSLSKKTLTKSSRGEYYTYCTQLEHIKDTCYKLYGKENVLEQVDRNKGLIQMWVNQSTFDKENELTIGRTIEVAKEQGGLYYLQHTKIDKNTNKEDDVQVQEVTKLTLILEQIQLPKPKVSILENSIEDVTNDMSIALRKGKQSCLKYPISQFMYIDHLSVQHQSFIVVIGAIKTPTSVKVALKDDNWVQPMKEEMKALEKNSTWEIIDRLKDKRIYTVKYKSDGTLEQYKTRLVAKGYTQTYGIDYEETFSLVAKMN
ncbi:putative mitochondrial protein, partial [Mucuna pruriens]